MKQVQPIYRLRPVRIIMLLLVLSIGIPGVIHSQGVASIVINEVQVSTSSTDWEFFEVTGTPGTDLSSLTLLVIESDVGTSSGRIDKFVNLSGTIPGDGFWWAASPTGQATYGADCGIADGTFSDNTFENSSTTNLLVSGFTGIVGDDVDVANDGVIDTTLWTEIIDGVALQNSASDYVYGGVVALGPDGWYTPSGVERLPDAGNFSSAFLNFSTPDGTPGVSNLSACGAIVINEVQVSTSSTDWEFFEVTGTPGTDLSSLTLLVIESDVGTSSGRIDKFVNLSGTIPGDGFWWAASPTGQATYGADCGIADGTFSDNTFENSSTTNLLVSGFTGVVGDDVDVANDGVIDTTLWTEIIDGVALQNSASDYVYGGVVALGPDGWYTPSGVERLPDAGNFSSAFLNFSNPDGTPGASNITGCETDSSEPTLAFIHDIQGDGASVTSPNTEVKVQAIVIADFTADDQLDGFYIQEEDADADANPATSEGIFVYCGSNNCGNFSPIAVGDIVTVIGVQEEFFGQSQIDAEFGSIQVDSNNNPPPAFSIIDLPVVGDIDAFYEPFEGMLVNFVDGLFVSEYFALAQFGEVVLYEGGRPFQYTQLDDSPTQAEFNTYQDELDRRRVIMNDDNTRSNSALPDGVFYYPQPDGFSISNFFRGGDVVQNLIGIMSYSFGEYRIVPVDPEYTTVFTPINPRPAPPASAGRLTVASFNVLNYFLTPDTTSSRRSGDCGASTTLDCRGADSLVELERQTDKLVSALLAIDADIYGIVEMENTPGVEPLARLVSEMNALHGIGVYDYVDTGVIGTDAIRVGIIYNTQMVSPIGSVAVLDDPSFVNPRNASIDRNRPAVAQTFVENATGSIFTVVVNHLKSKGSSCGAGDDDPLQGNCNLTRTLAVQALVDWLATNPTGVGDDDILIMGDLNAYAGEDPIDVLTDGNAALTFTDLIQNLGGSNSYSYVFDGQLGYLDYALASSSMVAQVADIAEWHINADEVNVLDYNDDVRDIGESFFEEEPDGNILYNADPYRTSDHDPVIVGLNLNRAPRATFSTLPPVPIFRYESVRFAFTDIVDEGGPLTFELDCTNDGTFDVVSNLDILACVYPDAGSFTARGRITDEFGDFNEYTLDIEILGPLEGVAYLDNLADGFSLNRGQANALDAKFINITRSLQNGRIEAALGQLQGVADQVQDFIDDGILSPIDGSSLISIVYRLMLSIGLIYGV